MNARLHWYKENLFTKLALWLPGCRQRSSKTTRGWIHVSSIPKVIIIRKSCTKPSTSKVMRSRKWSILGGVGKLSRSFTKINKTWQARRYALLSVANPTASDISHAAFNVLLIHWRRSNGDCLTAPSELHLVFSSVFLEHSFNLIVEVWRQPFWYIILLYNILVESTWRNTDSHRSIEL